MFKNKLNNYFILEILKSYFFILTILSLLLWVTQAARLLYLITETGLKIDVYISYVFFLLPKVISQLMLISFMISLFLSIIKFQNNKELEIYWQAGISKNYIIKLIIKISIIITIIAFAFFLYLVPLASAKSRTILASSEFSIINSMVKKNNFNSPLKDLTIFVNKNDNQGNLENIYIFENKKTIISKTGRVLNANGKNYLELSNGIIHEINEKNNISTIKFNKTIYNFTEFKTNLITEYKVQERNFSEILKEYFLTKNQNTLYEIHKRIFKPFFIPLIGILCCFALYSNNEKINLNKMKFIVFSITTFMIILIEIILNLSVLNNIYKYILYFFPFIVSIIAYLILNTFLERETKN